MSKALIQMANQSVQSIEENGIIMPGTIIRRFGCNLALNGNGVEIGGEGYFTIDAAVTVAPTAAGAVTVALMDNGVQVPGAIAQGYQATATQPLTLPIVATVRKRCCDGASVLTLVLQAGAGEVQNVSWRIVKE